MLKGRAGAVWLYAALIAAFILRHDLWLWNDARIMLGLPVGLLYHLVFCLGVMGLFALLVRFAWPKLDDEGEAQP